MLSGTRPPPLCCAQNLLHIPPAFLRYLCSRNSHFLVPWCQLCSPGAAFSVLVPPGWSISPTGGGFSAAVQVQVGSRLWENIQESDGMRHNLYPVCHHLVLSLPVPPSRAGARPSMAPAAGLARACQLLIPLSRHVPLVPSAQLLVWVHLDLFIWCLSITACWAGTLDQRLVWWFFLIMCQFNDSSQLSVHQSAFNLCISWWFCCWFPCVSTLACY